MAILLNGLLGRSKNKVGGVVTARWRELNTARAYVKPAYSRTDDQAVVRNKFKFIVDWGKQFHLSVIKPAWDKLSASIPGWNLFIKDNVLLTADVPVLTVNHLMSKGPLYNPGFVFAKFDNANYQMSVEYNASFPPGQGAMTDKAYIFLFRNTGELLGASFTALRDEAEAIVHYAGDADATCIAFILFVDDSGEETLFSASAAKLVTPI